MFNRPTIAGVLEQNAPTVLDQVLSPCMESFTVFADAALVHWPPPPGCPVDELQRVLDEHAAHDARVTLLLAALKRQRSAGDPPRESVQALSRLLESLQRERSHQLDVQIRELRALHGRTQERLAQMQQRVSASALQLQFGCERLDALRLVHAPLAQQMLAGLHVLALQQELQRMRQDSGRTWWQWAATRRAFGALCERLCQRLGQAQQRAHEIHAVMVGGFLEVEALCPLGLSAESVPSLEPFVQELQTLARSHARLLGPGNLWRLARPGFPARLQRLLQARLESLFEAAGAELERWSHALWTPAQVRLEHARERLRRRHDSVQRVQGAAEDLLQRVAELEAQELLECERFGHAQRLLARLADTGAPSSTSFLAGATLARPVLGGLQPSTV